MDTSENADGDALLLGGIYTSENVDGDALGDSVRSLHFCFPLPPFPFLLFPPLPFLLFPPLPFLPFPLEVDGATDMVGESEGDADGTESDADGIKGQPSRRQGCKSAS